MADNIEKTLDEIGEDASMSPVLDGMKKIGAEVVKIDKRAKADVEDVRKESKRGIEDLETKFNKTAEEILARIERVKDASTVLGRALRLEPGDDQLKSILTNEQKTNMALYERDASNLPAESTLKSPVRQALLGEWFALTGRAQLRRFAGQAAKLCERAEKVRNALQEDYLGANWTAVEKAAYAEDAATGEIGTTTGGYLVPTITEAEIQRLIKDNGDIFPRCRQIAMRGKLVKVPNEATAVTVNWIAEAGTLTGGENTFGVVELEAEKLAGRATMSLELLQDSAPGLLQYLLEVFSEKMAGELDKQMVLGDGSGPQITGIMSASGINAITSATAAGRALSLALLWETFVGASEKAARMDGVWIVSPKGYMVIGSLADTTGQSIIKFGDMVSAPYGTLLGRPVIVSARLGSNLTLDDVTNTATKIVFGPLSKALAGTRMGMTWEVTDQPNWATFQADARLVGRYAGNIAVPSAFTYLGQVAY